ncbi:peptidase PmbA [Candidatus Termititenax persephonae]|uniref:Peptidase PmbA n=1 Tax=Candidatus Termititenax persephonae TaxID=2218525 RepID=A0A388TH86_9BACT|nr:peptidase PmbA [Candidatus Termititenax persephonae]
MLDFKNYLRYAQDHGAAEAEIFYATGREESVEVRGQKIEKVESAGDRGLAVRVIAKKRSGFAYTSSLEADDIFKAIGMAITNAGYAEADRQLALPPRRTGQARPLRNYSATAAKLGLKQLAVLAKQTEAAAYAYDRRIFATESSTAFAAVSAFRLVNTRGVDVRQRKTLCGAAIEIAAQADSKMEAAYAYKYSVAPQKINPRLIGRQAAERAIRRLAAVPAQTGRYDIVLIPSVARDFLSVLSQLFSAENILRRKSLLCGKLGRRVASPQVTLLDNPFLPSLGGSYLYDGEGTPARPRVLLRRGVLQDFYYDHISALKSGQKSGGNALRGSIFSEPGIGPSNLYFQPGVLTQRQLLRGIARGALIEQIMGLHTADPISGEFSFGASGQLIQDGRLAAPIKDMAIAGNLQDLLRSIKACGKDLEFSGHYGSPSVLIENIMVAGK